MYQRHSEKTYMPSLPTYLLIYLIETIPFQGNPQDFEIFYQSDEEKCDL